LVLDHKEEITMNKSDLVKALAKETDLPMRKSEEIVDMVFNTMGDALERGDRIEIRGFGSFVVKEYKGYTGRNPKTGEQIVVQNKSLPFFKAGKELKENINK
jgi:integration host factor subunit beta